MPERMVWAIRAIPAGQLIGYDEDDEQEVTTTLVGTWEPFAIAEDYILCKKEVMIEDEKSSVNHPMSFSERYDG